ncbi:MAG: NAD(P)/FAD-dependent oxidoreductase [Candidatus Kerfeldbacteria bacterium]|nr:NAD(P)/FAD-dependent oxidoreductase [Candidatus Kerfeldbacteria bacterium]
MAGHPYSSFTRHHEHFDAIVIGSGMGGLSVSAMLAKAGKKVLMLEQHYILGGYTHLFRRRGYAWDVGLHYVGQVHIPGTFLNKAFRYITNEQLKWSPLDDIYDRAVFGDKEYVFPRGKENLRAQFKEYFPAAEDQVSIDAYFTLLEEVEHIGVGYYIEKALPVFLSKLIGPKLRSKVFKYSDRTTLEVLRSLTKNEQLIGVLTAQYGDYGLQPAESSFYMHALLANHYMDGAGYPVGGAGSIAETVVPVIEAAGGTALHQVRVTNIIVEQNKAIGVKLADGKTIYADNIISDAGIHNTYHKLLPAEVAKQHHLEEQLQQLSPSGAHMGLYVGIKDTPENLHLPKCNYWIFPNEYNHELNQQRYENLDATLPVSYVSFPAAKDPDSQKHHPGRSTVEVIIIVPYDWFKQWEGTEWRKRGEEYQQMKARMAEKMFADLYRVAPQLKGKVDYFDISSPLSTKKFTDHPFGEIYGIAHTPKRFRQAFLRPQTPVKNLYLTGQDVMIASIAGGLMGGLLCASAILHKNMMGVIKKSIQ